jgi:hypothetical protein
MLAWSAGDGVTARGVRWHGEAAKHAGMGRVRSRVLACFYMVTALSNWQSALSYGDLRGQPAGWARYVVPPRGPIKNCTDSGCKT